MVSDKLAVTLAKLAINSSSDRKLEDVDSAPEYRKRKTRRNQVKVVSGMVCEEDKEGNLRNCRDVKIPVEEFRGRQ